MVYSVKEMFYTLQGEGGHAGRPSVFVRFSGCNLWTGLEKDRAKAVCQFCDTDFVGTDGEGGGKFKTPQDLVDAVIALWPVAYDKTQKKEGKSPYVVCTGGEPLLQLDQKLIDCFQNNGCLVAIESNGTKPVPQGIDWICISPKSSSDLIQIKGNELKLVYPQLDALPERFQHLDFDFFYLQPMDNENRIDNTQKAIEYCKAHPRWRLSLQTHKILDIP